MAQTFAPLIRICVLLSVLLAGPCLQAQLALDAPDPFFRDNRDNHDGASAPLSLNISGEGRVLPFEDGEQLPIGWSFVMTAIPDHGYVFTGWQKVNITTISQFNFDAEGNPEPPTISTVVSPVPGLMRQPTLRFQVQAPIVIIGPPNQLTVTLSTGWQANFVSIRHLAM
jgi:Divergent InlB B-repeat domain